MNFEISGVCDLWNRRREEGVEYIKQLSGNKKVDVYRNTEEMYEKDKVDAVIISTADFQHALLAAEAAGFKKDVYCEKPFAETMEDNRVALKGC